MHTQRSIGGAGGGGATQQRLTALREEGEFLWGSAEIQVALST